MISWLENYKMLGNCVVFYCSMLYHTLKKSNQIFIILALLRRSVERVAGPISTDQRLGNTVLKKRHSGGESLATLCPI